MSVTYGKGFLKIGGTLANTEVESWEIDVTDGGEDIKALVGGLQGRAGGAAMSTLTFSGTFKAISDTGGSGMLATGMLANGVPLDRTMLVAGNQNNGKPVVFTGVMGINQDADQSVSEISFEGNINNFKYTGSDTTVKFSGTATGKMAFWGNPGQTGTNPSP